MSAEEGAILVEVEAVVQHEGTVWVFSGREHETGDIVTFGADWRPARDIAEALGEGDEPIVAAVPDWAVVSRAASQ